MFLTLQVITFTEIFLRVTYSRKVIVICPVNVILNWQAEFEKWLPIANGVRTFKTFLCGDNVKTQKSRMELLDKWSKEGGVLLIGYELFRLLTRSQRPTKVHTEVIPYEGLPQTTEQIADCTFLAA